MKRVLAIGTVVASMLTATGAIAYAAGSSNSVSANRQHPAAGRARPAAAIDTTTESKFTPIAPCRAIDTRTTGGAFAANVQRTYNLATECSVPYNSTAVSATITTVASHRASSRLGRTARASR